MAKKQPKQSDLPTRNRVLQYAEQLRDEASRARLRDPNVELYAPSKEAASRECSKQTGIHGKELGPQKALEVLARRAFEAERKMDDADALARIGRRGLVVAQSVAAGEREAVRASQSLGARLDAALLGLGLASEARTVHLDADRVTGSKAGSGIPRARDEHGDLQREASRMVLRVEREAERARRQLVEEVSAA